MIGSKKDTLQRGGARSRGRIGPHVGRAIGSRILARVQRRAAWIVKQLLYFEQFQPRPVVRLAHVDVFSVGSAITSASACGVSQMAICVGRCPTPFALRGGVLR